MFPLICIVLFYRQATDTAFITSSFLESVACKLWQILHNLVGVWNFLEPLFEDAEPKRLHSSSCESVGFP